ncbi:hypothetical protein LPJ73_004444, partial [Coemansia sp. RSA 2703]
MRFNIVKVLIPRYLMLIAMKSPTKQIEVASKPKLVPILPANSKAETQAPSKTQALAPTNNGNSDSDDDDELDDKPLISLVKRINKRKQESKPAPIYAQDVSSESSVKRQRADTDFSVHDQHVSANVSVLDPEQPTEIKPSESIQRPTDILDDYLTLVFQEEDQLSEAENGDSKHVYFRKILQDHGNSYVVNKRALRRIRALVAPCTPVEMTEFISEDIVSRLIGLLVSAVETANDMGLATMIKDGSELDKDVELSSEF